MSLEASDTFPQPEGGAGKDADFAVSNKPIAISEGAMEVVHSCHVLLDMLCLTLDYSVWCGHIGTWAWKQMMFESVMFRSC